MTTYSPSDLFGSGIAPSHFVITGASSSVRVDVAYQAASGPGSPAHVPEKTTFAKTWHLYPGDWSEVFDGVAIVNVGSASTSVTVSQVRYTGAVLDTQTIDGSLAVNEKALAVLGGPDGGLFDSVPNVYYAISGSQNLAIVALRGTVPGAPVGLLWENSARPADTLTIEPSQEPIAYYPLDGDAQDEGDFGNDGVLHGAGTVPDRFGRYSRAMFFDGVDDYIEIPHHPALDLQELTITMWALAADPAARTFLLCKGDEVPYSLGTKNVTFEFEVGNAQTDESVQSLTAPDGTWHFIACVYDGNTMKIYADGFLQDQTSFSATLMSDNGPMNLGRNPIDRDDYFHGILDEIRIFNRALSEQEILLLFTQ